MAAVVENFHNLSLFDNYANCGALKNGLKLMYSETDRLKTFDTWPLKFLDPRHLAKAGFYYMKKNDLVRCAFCKIEIMKWQPGDNAMTEHRRWSENCPFVHGLYSGNDGMDKMSVMPEARDKKLRCGIEIRPNSLPEWKTIDLTGNDRINSQKLDLTKQGARYLEYKTYESRLKSFSEWPPSIKQKPDQLAAAGFFYNGKGDQTICFHCGLGLKDWADDDDPWEQHTRWSSKCSFVLSQKDLGCYPEVSSKQKPCLTKEEVVALHKPCCNKPICNKNTQTSSASSSSSITSRFPKVVTENIIPHNPKDANNTKEVSVILCKRCHLKEKSILFLPCRHIVVCEDCATLLTTCLACNKPLEATVKVNVSVS